MTGEDFKEPSKMTDEELVVWVNKRRKEARDDHDEWRKEAKEDYNFVASHQYDEEDIAKLESEDRPIITFNRTNVHISAIIGMEANQRQETTFLPRESSDSILADAIKQTDDWIRDYAGIEVEEAEAFEDMITCGIGFTDASMDYEEDLDGKVIQERLFPLEVGWDPAAKKRNLKDKRWVFHERKLFLMDIKETWPDAEITMPQEELLTDDADSFVFVNPAERYNAEDTHPPTSSTKGIPVTRIQWFETHPVYRVGDPRTGKIIELSEKEFKENKEILDEGKAVHVKQKKKKYFQAFVAGDALLEKGDCPSQVGFTINAITGKRDHIHKQWYGIVRLMKDPQRWSNKFFSQIIDIIDSNAKGGVIIEEGAVQDMRAFEESWAKVDSITKVTTGAIAGGKIQPKPVAQYPQGLDRLMNFAISAIREVTGMNLETLGMAERQQANVLEETRKRSALTILAGFFDAFRAYRKTAGLLRLEFIKEYMPTRRITEVLEPKLQQAASMIKEVDLRGINVIVSEAAQSDNHKMVTWMFINQVLPALMNSGLPVPPEILEYTPLPATLTAQWKKLIEQQSQDPTKQMLTQLELTLKQLEIKEKEAKIGKNTSDGQLSQAKAQSEQADTMAVLQDVELKKALNALKGMLLQQGKIEQVMQIKEEGEKEWENQSK
jgi:hypothetical protein